MMASDRGERDVALLLVNLIKPVTVTCFVDLYETCKAKNVKRHLLLREYQMAVREFVKTDEGTLESIHPRIVAYICQLMDILTPGGSDEDIADSFVPELERGIFVEVARELWKQPLLVFDNIPSKARQEKLEQLNVVVERVIKGAVKKLMTHLPTVQVAPPAPAPPPLPEPKQVGGGNETVPDVIMKEEPGPPPQYEVFSPDISEDDYDDEEDDYRHQEPEQEHDASLERQSSMASSQGLLHPEDALIMKGYDSIPLNIPVPQPAALAVAQPPLHAQKGGEEFKEVVVAAAPSPPPQSPQSSPPMSPQAPQRTAPALPVPKPPKHLWKDSRSKYTFYLKSLKKID